MNEHSKRSSSKRSTRPTEKVVRLTLTLELAYHDGDHAAEGDSIVPQWEGELDLATVKDDRLISDAWACVGEQGVDEHLVASTARVVVRREKVQA